MGTGPGMTDGTVSCLKETSNDLWTKKHRPFNLDSHVINKKKKEEFVKICTASAEPPSVINGRVMNKVKILILQGPSGSGKNSLIDCFGKDRNFEIIRYVEQKSSYVVDVFGENETLELDENKWYPDDLSSLTAYIRQLKN